MVNHKYYEERGWPGQKDLVLRSQKCAREQSRVFWCVSSVILGGWLAAACLLTGFPVEGPGAFPDFIVCLPVLFVPTVIVWGVIWYCISERINLAIEQRHNLVCPNCGRRWYVSAFPEDCGDDDTWEVEKGWCRGTSFQHCQYKVWQSRDAYDRGEKDGHAQRTMETKRESLSKDDDELVKLQSQYRKMTRGQKKSDS